MRQLLFGNRIKCDGQLCKRADRRYIKARNKADKAI